jgi:hypothetical protein
MTEFTVHLANRPGMLAALTEQLADAGINIEALAAYGVDGEGIVRLMVDNEVLTRKIFSRDSIDWVERTVLSLTLPHEPGAVASMARKLADSGANIDAMYLLGSSADGLHFAVAVDDADTAAGTLAV